MNMVMGRPSKYTPELLEAAWAYVNGGWLECGDKIPSVAGMACEIGITRELAHLWVNDKTKSEFFDIMKALAQKQERTLTNHGLDGTYSTTITKLILTKHGYSDKIEQDNTSSDKSMTPQVIERIIVTPDED